MMHSQRLVRRISFFALTAALSSHTPASANQPLRVHADERGIFIGVAIDVNALNSIPQYRTLAGTQFSSITAENAMKWDATEPSRGLQLHRRPTRSSPSRSRTTSRSTATPWSGTARRRPGCRGWAPRPCAPPCRTTSPPSSAATPRNPAVVAWDVVNEVVRRQRHAAVQRSGSTRSGSPTSPTPSASLGRPTRRAALHQRLQRRGDQREEHRDVRPGAVRCGRRACRSTASGSGPPHPSQVPASCSRTSSASRRWACRCGSPSWTSG